MRLIYIIYLLVIVISCKKENTKPKKEAIQGKVVKKDASINTKVSLSKLNHKNITNIDSLPFGNKLLIKTDFPKSWLLENSKVQNKFNTVFFELQDFFDNYKSKGRFENTEFNNVENIVNQFYSSKKPSKNYLKLDVVAKLPDIYEANIYILTKYIASNQVSSDLIIIDANEIRELNIYSYKEKGYNSWQKLFYIDKEYNIHVKNFKGDEETNSFLNYEIFKITSNKDFKKM